MTLRTLNYGNCGILGVMQDLYYQPYEYLNPQTESKSLPFAINSKSETLKPKSETLESLIPRSSGLNSLRLQGAFV